MPKCLDKSEMAYLNFREAESPAKSSQFPISKLQRSTKPQTQNRPARHLPPASDFEGWCLRFGTSLELGAWCLVFGSEAVQKLRCAPREGVAFPDGRDPPRCRSRRRLGRRLIDDAPESAELTDGIDEIVELHRLDHVGIDTQFVAFEQVALFV